MIKIDFGQIITNVVSAVVVLIVVGAAGLIWQRAASVDGKVNAATAGLKVVVEEVQTGLIDLQKQNNELAEQNNALATTLNELQAHLLKMDEFHDTLEPTSLPEGHPPIKKFIPRAIKDPDFLQQKMAPYEQMNR
jgi:hypothetical protein